MDNFEATGYNKLFMEWLKEWREEAANSGSKIQYTYANAIKSLRNYPLPIYSGNGCQHLQYFGDFTCKKLEKKLLAYLKENKITRVSGPDPLVTTGQVSALLSQGSASAATKSPKRASSPKKGRTKASKPADDSSPSTKPKRKKPIKQTEATDFDIGTFLAERGEHLDTISDLPAIPARSRTTLKKTTSTSSVVSIASSRQSSTAGGTSSFTASVESVASVSSLSSTTSIRKPAAVLTYGGKGKAGFVARTASSSDNTDNGVLTKAQCLANKFSQIPFEEFTLFPGTFDVVLCVDNQEIHGRGSTRTKLDIITELQSQNVRFEVRSLKAGDFLWIAKEKMQNAVGRTPRELVLDFIAERKRGDDLAVSIKDGRYHCQKFRMKSSTLRRILYIIEDPSKFSEKGLADQAIYQAMSNMSVQDGFIVKETGNLRETAQYLLMMTQYLQQTYATKILRSSTYSSRCEDTAELNLSLPNQNLLSFATFSAVTKTNQARTVSQALILQLLALDGVSPAKATAIVQQFPTLRFLLAAYDECSSDNQRHTLLKEIKFGTGLSTIGPTISKKLSRFYTSRNGPDG